MKINIKGVEKIGNRKYILSLKSSDKIAIMKKNHNLLKKNKITNIKD